MRFRIFAPALLLTAAGCTPLEEQTSVVAGSEARVAAPAQAATTQQVTQAQNGSTVTLPVGGQLIVSLPGNRTTGYHWAVAAKPANLIAAGADYVQEAAPAGMVGVGGTERFTFRAAGAGTGRLRLEHRAPGTGTVADTWQINVVVR